MTSRKALILVFGLLLLVSLACQQGTVVTIEEATETAVAARGVRVGTPTPVNVRFDVGQTVTLAGTGSLINLYDEAGSKRMLTQAERGARVEVLQTSEVSGAPWYLIDTSAGQGWVPAQSLLSIEDAGDISSGQVAGGPQPGDTVYLAGKAFMVNLFQEAGASRFFAQQGRGSAVIVEQVTEVDGEPWYLISSGTGQGWVPAESISTEPPQ